MTNGMKKITTWLGRIITGGLLVVLILSTLLLLQSKIKGTAPSLFGYELYVVESGSMRPTIGVGSLIVVQLSDAETIKPGDIITYRGNNSTVLVTHRVAGIKTQSPLQFTTKGDANSTEDPLPVSAEQLRGKVVGWIPLIGNLFQLVRTKKGFLVLVVLPLTLLALSFIFPQGRKKETSGEGISKGDEPSK